MVAAPPSGIDSMALQAISPSMTSRAVLRGGSSGGTVSLGEVDPVIRRWASGRGRSDAPSGARLGQSGHRGQDRREMAGETAFPGVAGGAGGRGGRTRTERPAVLAGKAAVAVGERRRQLGGVEERTGVEGQRLDRRVLGGIDVTEKEKLAGPTGGAAGRDGRARLRLDPVSRGARREKGRGPVRGRNPNCLTRSAGRERASLSGW